MGRAKAGLLLLLRCGFEFLLETRTGIFGGRLDLFDRTTGVRDVQASAGGKVAVLSLLLLLRREVLLLLVLEDLEEEEDEEEDLEDLEEEEDLEDLVEEDDLEDLVEEIELRRLGLVTVAVSDSLFLFFL